MDRIAFEEFLGEAKLAWVLKSWMNETTEDDMIERFSVQPGDLYRLISTSKWLLHASLELATLFGHKDLLERLTKVVVRIEKGVKPELLPLVKLEGVGRARARTLFNNGLKTIDDIKMVPLPQLTKLPLFGPRIAKKIKEEVGALIKDEDWERVKKGKSEQQRALTEF